MMDTVVKWKDNDGKYQLFDNTEINHMSRDHAISLFSCGIPVIASENGTYITNSKGLADQYRNQGKRVMMFSDMTASSEKFGLIGFLS
jgi:hypothetical protein